MMMNVVIAITMKAMHYNIEPLLETSHVINNVTNERINCQHPSIVLNPAIRDLIAQHRNYTFKGVMHYIKDSRLYCHFKTILPAGKYISLEDIDNCYVTDFDSGEIFPMYFLAPCGHCEICKETKIASFANRCIMESQCYDAAPWFVTLTYNDACLPPDGASVSDVQNFFKRLRSRFDYYGVKNKLRYVAVAEYGSNTHRIHYHALIWNFPKKYKYWDVRTLMREVWTLGHVYLSQVSSTYVPKGSRKPISNPDKVYEYVAKYICKDCFVPFGQNPVFRLTSRRHGGIGAPFIDQHASLIRREKRYEFKFVDKFTQKIKPMIYSRYVLGRLFPTWSMSVPSVLRNEIKFILRFGHQVDKSSKALDVIRQRFKPHMFWAEVFPFDWNRLIHNSNAPRWVRCRSCPLIIKSFWKFVVDVIQFKFIDFDLARDLAAKRNYVTSKLAQNKSIVFLPVKARDCKKWRDRQFQREIL